MRLALMTINPTVGDLLANAALITGAIAAARAAHADVALLPELAMCGYPPKDLLLHEGFVAACVRACDDAGTRATRRESDSDRPITAIIGTPVPVDAQHPQRGTHNALAVYRDGVRIATYAKRLLPTYDVFDEDRYFVPGSEPVVLDLATPTGTQRLGLTICEDLWRGEDAGFSTRYAHAPNPVAELVARGATTILSASASPFVLGKGQRHRDILAGHARRHGVVVASVNQLGGNDDLVFDGHRLLFARDGALASCGAFMADEPLIVDIPPPSPIASGRTPREATMIPDDDRLLFDALVLGVRDYLRKTGFSKALLGLSGGVDSALTCCIAVAALGREHVLGVSMPGPYSSSHSIRDAHELAAALGVICLDAPIASAFEGHAAIANAAFESLRQPRLGATLPDLTEENLQSRIRGTLLMTLSNRTGAMVLTTGNKSEMAVGYATLYGDMNGGLAVLSDVDKQWVYRLSRFINARWRELPGLAHSTTPPIPASTLDKPPSAELRPNQTDQDSLPAYDVLDRIIDMYVEERVAPMSIARATGFDGALVAKICRMIDLAEYKRRQAAVGLKVTSVAFGAGRRYPIAQRWRG